MGIGLSNLFASCGLEKAEFAEMDELSNHMGLFLQKTNIIRDYLEDITEEPTPRMFWPKEIWGKYAHELEDFQAPERRESAVACLNHMVTDALQHAVHSLEYMAHLRHKWVFRFCAIPQIMAIGTLANCYNNGRVFEGVVKLRRGQTAKLMVEMEAFPDLLRGFLVFAGDIAAEVNPRADPNAQATLQVLDEIEDRCRALLREAGLRPPGGGGRGPRPRWPASRSGCCSPATPPTPSRCRACGCRWAPTPRGGTRCSTACSRSWPSSSWPSSRTSLSPAGAFERISPCEENDP